MMRTDAYRAFKKCLFSGELKPGQFVSQRELAALLAVPLNPIREAIRQLECERLIKVYPQKGIQIIEADPKTINDAHDYRLLLEQAAIVEFTRNADRQVIGRMGLETERVIVALESAPNDRDVVNATIEAAWNFHDEIIDFQDNAIVSHHYRLNSARIRLFRSNSYRSTITDHLAPSLRHHLAILDACARGDTDDACGKIADDIETSRSITLGLKAG